MLSNLSGFSAQIASGHQASTVALLLLIFRASMRMM